MDKLEATERSLNESLSTIAQMDSAAELLHEESAPSRGLGPRCRRLLFGSDEKIEYDRTAPAADVAACSIKTVIKTGVRKPILHRRNRSLLGTKEARRSSSMPSMPLRRGSVIESSPMDGEYGLAAEETAPVRRRGSLLGGMLDTGSRPCRRGSLLGTSEGRRSSFMPRMPFRRRSGDGNESIEPEKRKTRRRSSLFTCTMPGSNPEQIVTTPSRRRSLI